MDGIPIDPEYFDQIRPAQKPVELFKVWARVAFIWLAFGLPSAALMLLVMCRMCCDNGAGFDKFQDADEDPFGKSATPAGIDAAYGPLVDISDPENAEAVNRWVYRGAFGAIVYGITLLALGITLSVHMAQADSASVASLEALEMLESLFMAGSKAAVTRAACMLHFRLLPVARQLAGPWVLIFAIAKLLMSILAVGFSIWRVQVRAAPYAGGEERVGGWVSLLVAGQFGAGVAVWWAGYLGAVHENDIAMGGCFIIAALAQLVAGTSMLLVNRKIKQRFRQPTQTQADVVAATFGRRDEGAKF